MGVIEEIGTTAASIVSSPWSVTLIPLLFYACGALGKRLIRDERSKWLFVLADIYLAPEASLANVGTALGELWELIAKFDAARHRGEIRGTILLGAVAFFVYLVVLVLHKHYNNEAHGPLKRFLLLGVFCNGLALLVMLSLIIATKGLYHG